MMNKQFFHKYNYTCKVTKIYDEAKTPYRRLLISNISEKIKNNGSMIICVEKEKSSVK